MGFYYLSNCDIKLKFDKKDRNFDNVSYICIYDKHFQEDILVFDSDVKFMPFKAPLIISLKDHMITPNFYIQSFKIASPSRITNYIIVKNKIINIGDNLISNQIQAGHITEEEFLKIPNLMKSIKVKGVE